MDVDQPAVPAVVDPQRPPQQTNAVAGPSRISAAPDLFLPPPGLRHPSSDPSVTDWRVLAAFLAVGHPQPQTYLRSTQDLVTRFNLLSAYDKYVRPFATPTPIPDEARSVEPPTPGGMDKGKGKQRETSMPFAAPTPAGLNDGDGDDDEGGKGDKRRKNNYRHLIKGIPGVHFVPYNISNMLSKVVLQANTR
jgi:hypothetical protein